MLTGTSALKHAAALVIVTCVAAAAPAWAEDVSFSGKTVRMIVNSTAGGVTDLGARVVARFMGKHMPGAPTIVVQNMPGANGIAGTNYFYQQAAPDGLSSLSGSSSQVMPDLVRNNPQIRYDMLKMPMIGGVQYAGTLLVASRSAIERLNGAPGEPVVMAVVGAVRTGGMAALWGAEYLGWKMRFVTGYAGTPQLALAMERNEAEMMHTTGVGGIENLLKDKARFGVVAQTGIVRGGKLVRRDQFQDVPLVSELLDGKLSGDGKRAFSAWTETMKLGKYFALPPNTPEPLVAAYRAAFEAMQSDPEFKAQAEINIEPGYVMMSADETVEVIKRIAAIPDADLALIDRLREKYHLPAEGGASASEGKGKKGKGSKDG
jgi:hypothetical protein